MNAINFAENGMLPYWLIRFGIRMRLRRKLALEAQKNDAERVKFVEDLAHAPIAKDTDKANEQHYELPTEFFQLVLGPNLKYSACYWPEGCQTLAEAEALSLRQVSLRAEIKDGMKILDMGCGWGSFSLWAAKHFPQAEITSVSNSRIQGDFIRNLAKERGLMNLDVITADMNHFDPKAKYDRVVSIEMLEHMRNYDSLFLRVSQWIKDDGKLFAHVFSHGKYAYEYNDKDENEWMAKHFFTGGIMPSHSLLPSFNRDLEALESWKLNGVHYQKTSEAWLQNMNRNEERILEIFADCYGKDMATKWMWRWRLFFLACAELFGYKEGSEWGVSHYLFAKKQS